MLKAVPSLAFAILTLIPCTSLTAQLQLPLPLAPGERVRITAPSIGAEDLVCSIVALRPDALMVRARWYEAPSRIPTASVTRLDVQRGRKSRTLTGLGIGLIGGALLGGLIDGSSVGGAVAGGVVLGGLGAGVGALIKTDRWTEVPMDEFRTSATRSGNVHFGFGVAISF